LKYLLDTNIISELTKTTPNENVISFLGTIKEQDIYLSVITIGEISFGIHKLQSQKKRENLSYWLENDLLIRFQNRIVDIDIETMLIWGELSQRLKTSGTPMPIMDSLIGATCLTKGHTLISRNEKDFANLDIRVINPFKVEY